MKIEEVAMRVGVSVQTLNRWYKFKKENPEDEISKKLPEYRMINTLNGKARDWTDAAVWQLIAFKASVKPGRNGKMGKYGGKGTHGKKEN